MFKTTRTLALLAVVAVAFACGGETPEADEATVEVATYAVRGRVLEMPSAPGEEIRIEHVAIDDFVDYRGEVVGMDAMTMSFPLAEGAAGDIVPGDIVEFELRVDWNAEPLSVVTRLTKLPPETELVFRAAEPPAPE